MPASRPRPADDSAKPEGHGGRAKRPVRYHSLNVRSKLGGMNVGIYPLHEFIFDYTLTPPQNWPLRIDFAGLDTWVRGCHRYREFSDTFALEYVKEGTFEFTQNRAKYTVPPGRAFLVRRNANSEIRCRCPMARKRTMAASGALLEAVLHGAGLESADVIALSDPGRLDDLLDQVDAVLSRRDAGRLVRGSALVYEILLLLGRDYQKSDLPEVLQQILAHFDANLEAPHTVESLARAFHLSPASLHRLFREHLRETPINYLIHKRMEVARRMLRLTTQSVKHVAYAVGYRSALYFSSEFHRLTGESPRAFRVRCQRGE